jgi:actin-related protein
MVEYPDKTTDLQQFLGYCLLNAIRRVDFAGRDLTTELQTLLHEKGQDFISGGKLKQT